MLWIIWLEALMRHLLARKRGKRCRAGIISRPAPRQKKMRKNSGFSTPRRIGMLKKMNEPRMATINPARIEKERTPEGVQFK
ncbi:hypothetical protein J4421_06385 [Candidatus Woesearchaeota archaeon]|nr:hypothetical protein [Candidatus Woesearchaeota archaeon]